MSGSDSPPKHWVELSAAGDFAALVALSEPLCREEPDKAALWLWQIARDCDDERARQVLSFHLVRNLSGKIARGALLWLLDDPPGDAGTLANILSALTAEAVERDGVPDFVVALLPGFFDECLLHRDVSVRISVLDFLRDSHAARGWPTRLGRTAAHRLADALEARLSADVEEEECQELEAVCAGLRSRAIPLKPRIAPEKVDPLVRELEVRPATAALAAIARVCRLSESARARAQADGRPVVTIRTSLEGDEFLGRALEVVDLCRLEMAGRGGRRAESFAAPPASRAWHIRAGVATTRATFERFRVASQIALGEVEASSVFVQLKPRQGGALAGVLRSVAGAGVRAEFILTPEDVGEPSESVVLKDVTAGMDAWQAAADSAAREALSRPEVYSDEVPQANELSRVLQAVRVALTGRKPKVGDIDGLSSDRQVLYYTHAARVLGLLDEDTQPTAAAANLKRARDPQWLDYISVAFESSMVGRAWKAWARKKVLASVPPETAEEFLRDRAIGVGGDTLPRRSSTLRTWHEELYSKP